MKYKCIIFDCDGILVDSEGISDDVLIEMAKEIGVHIDEDYIKLHFAGCSLKFIFETLEDQIIGTLPPNFVEDYRTRTFNRFKTDLRPISGIHELLEQIETPICVASSGPPNKIELNLTTTKLIEKFKGRIYSSYDIGVWKPNPDIFLFAAEKMGFKPEECAVIEDSLAGVKAGIAGGFDVYALANNTNKDLFIEEGANVFFKMNELYKMLNL